MKKKNKKTEDAWNKILHSGRVLTDKEAEDMKKIIDKTRREYGFRT